MIKWGNQRANIFWEAELNGKLPIEGNMETWIRAKYEQRKWAAPGPVPEPSMIQQTDQGNGTVAQRSKINQAKSTNTGEFDQHYHSTTSRLESRDNSATKPVTSTGKAATPPLSHTIANRLDVVSFQEQLSGLSVRGEQSPGLIPKAPPGSNMSWTNFLTAHKPADTNTTLAQTSTEKPLIPLDAFASLLKQ
ncbi:hypothetical protein [Parasitella parasitica]|uniref:Arf-GAP domain-containing protein n=1 Tax=Parasitella parasitica TaxID=35722 RepID=A0A0B7NEV3_9FUNG|nr:hypothetical protein [Parasitella parasitica]